MAPQESKEEGKGGAGAEGEGEGEGVGVDTGTGAESGEGGGLGGGGTGAAEAAAEERAAAELALAGAAGLLEGSKCPLCGAGRGRPFLTACKHLVCKECLREDILRRIEKKTCAGQACCCCCCFGLTLLFLFLFLFLFLLQRGRHAVPGALVWQGASRQ